MMMMDDVQNQQQQLVGQQQQQQHPAAVPAQVMMNGNHHNPPALPPGPEGRVLHVAWTRLHAYKTISIPPGTQIYAHELKETLYAALLRADGRTIISREDYNKHILVGLYYLHKGESRLLPLSVLVQRLDYFATKRLYLIDPDMVVHDWSISCVRSLVLTFLILLLLLIFVKGPAMGTFIFLAVVFGLLVSAVSLYLVFIHLLPQNVQDAIETVLQSVVLETLLCSSAAQVLLILVIGGVFYGLPQSQHLAAAAVERTGELLEAARQVMQAIRGHTMRLLVAVDNYSDGVFIFLYEHGWLGLPLELGKEDERRSITHMCSRLFSNGVGFWESNYSMCETLLAKRIRASALQMKKGVIMVLLCASFMWILNRLTYVPSAERRGGFSWLSLVEWALVLGFAFSAFIIPFDTFDLTPGYGSF